MIIVGADLCVCPNDIGVQQLADACIIAKLMYSESRINYCINKLLYSIIDMVRE
jgi:hypothetical protein